MTRASFRAGMTIETSGDSGGLASGERRAISRRLRSVRPSARIQRMRTMALRTCMWFPVAGFRLPEDRKPATGNRQLLGGPHPPLRLQRVWRVGILHGDAPVGFLRFHAVALRVVRVRQKDQQRIGRKNGIALVDFPLQLAGNLSRFAILDAQLIQAESRRADDNVIGMLADE